MGLNTEFPDKYSPAQK